jgi:GntR family transcriptional regulator
MAPKAKLSRLRRADPRALHEQLSVQLRADVVKNVSAGEQIPTEEAISQAYSVSRVTVRRAIQTLVDQGLLIRRQGKGTFTAAPRPRVTYEIDRLGPFMDAFATSGIKATARLIDFFWSSEEPVTRCFGTSEPALVYERLYETDGIPHGYLKIAIPGPLAERVSRADAETKGVYEILRKRGRIAPVRASFSISSELPDAALAKHLRVSRATPVLSVDRISYSAEGEPIERSLHYLLPDVYKLSVNVQAG